MQASSGLTNLLSASVFAKVAALIASTCAILCVFLVVMDTLSMRSFAKSYLREFAASATGDLAMKSGRAIRFRDDAEIARLVADFEVLAGERVEAVMVLDSAGSVVFGPGAQEDLRTRLAGFSGAETVDFPLDARRFVKAVPVFVGVDNRVGSIGVIWTTAPLLREVSQKTLVVALLSLVVLAGLLAVAAKLTRRVLTEPLREIGQVLSQIAAEDYGSEVVGTHRADELGDFARNIDALRLKLLASRALQSERALEQEEQKRVVGELRSGLSALSEGDLTRSLDRPFAETYEPLRADFNEGLAKLRGIMAAVQDNSMAVRGGAEEISASSDSLARRTEIQAAALEETSATLTQMTEAGSEAARNAREVEEIVIDAQAQTRENDIVVQDAVGAMSEIEASSDQISSIISVIDDIAFQTNLLALNAGVEAARAGEAGRGFAVVASEVRSLAQRSAEAAKEIKELINGSAGQIRRGVGLVNKAGEALSSVSARISHISGLVSQIASSAAEQANGVAEINAGVTQMDQVTQENAAMVEQSNAAGHLLRQQATELTDLVAQFRIDGGDVRGHGVAQMPGETARVA
jgi:methyl-accepting chemotaxis protein